MANKHYRLLNILLISLTLSFILTFTAAATKAFAAITWTANQAGNFTGKIIIPTGESTTRYGEWWAGTVEIYGTIKVDSYVAGDPNKGWFAIHANSIVIGSAGTVDATGAGYFGGAGGSKVSGGGGGEGGLGGRGSSDDEDIKEKGRGNRGDTGNTGKSGEGQFLGFERTLSGEGGAPGEYGHRPDLSWGVTQNAHGGRGGGAGAAGKDGYGGVYSYYNYYIGFDPRGRGNSNSDITNDTEVGMGFGGGGGGSGGSGGGGCGGAGSWFYYNGNPRNGGKGGKGGTGEAGADGGRGGGYIRLYAKNAFTLNGTITTQGLPGSDAPDWHSPGRDGSDGEGGNKGNGGKGGSVKDDPGSSGNPSTAFYDSAGGGGGGAGGYGGSGGGGAGGGVLIYCNKFDGISIDPDARINTRGGEHSPDYHNRRTGNGGTLKIFYSGTEPTFTQSDGGRSLQGMYFSSQVPAWDAPTAPSAKSPADDFNTQIPIPNILSWECSSPVDHLLTYKVYLGIATNPPNDNPGLIGTSINIKTFNVSDLLRSTLYCWRVIAHDNETGAETPPTKNFYFFTEGDTGTIKVKTYRRINLNNQKMSVYPTSFTVTGPRAFSGATDSSGNWSMPTMLGNYSITFEAKYGVTPPQQNFALGIGQTITLVATCEISDLISPSKPILHVPQANETSSVPISWEAAIDNQTEVTGYKLNISGQEIPLGNVTQYTKTFPVDGKFEAFVTAYDLADNAASSGVVSFEVNFNKPDITISSNKNKYGPGGFPSPISAPKRSPLVIETSDGNDISSLEVFLKDGDGDEIKSVSGSMKKVTLNIDDLKEGDYSLNVTATDKGTNPRTNGGIFSITILSGNAEIVGKPYNYPNPFNLETKPAKAIHPETRTIIVFTLAGDTETKIIIYNSAGKPVKTFKCNKGATGGKIGENLLEWDGRDNFGNPVANGPYYYYIIVNGKVIGKGDMAAFR